MCPHPSARALSKGRIAQVACLIIKMSVFVRYEIAITWCIFLIIFPLLLWWHTLKSTFIRNYHQTIKSFCQSSISLIFTELSCFVLWISLKRFYGERGPIVFLTFCVIKTLIHWDFQLNSFYYVFSKITTFMKKLWFTWNFQHLFCLPLLIVWVRLCVCVLKWIAWKSISTYLLVFRHITINQHHSLSPPDTLILILL